MESSEGEAIVMRRLGDALFKYNLYDGAIAAYYAAIKHDPGRMQLVKCLADVYKANGDYLRVEALYVAPLQKQPDSLWLWWNLCEMHLAKKDFNSALNMCMDGLRQYPSNPSLLLLLSSLHAATGNYKDAISIQRDNLENNVETRNKLESMLVDFIEQLSPSDFKEKELKQDLSKRYGHLTPSF
jgi:tetratricopeptide (TPR) repeat protein